METLKIQPSEQTLIKEGGGLTWLQYELAVPLAIILVMAFLIPFFRKLKLVRRVGVTEELGSDLLF